MKKTTKILAAISGLVILGSAGRAAAWGVGLSLHSGADEQLCMDARGDGKGAGTEVWMHSCNRSEAQRWAISRWTDNWSEIVGPGGLCVAAHDNKTAYMYGCTGADNEKFKHEGGHLIHKETGKCLTVPMVGETQPLVLETCEEKPKQVWKTKQE